MVGDTGLELTSKTSGNLVVSAAGRAKSDVTDDELRSIASGLRARLNPEQRQRLADLLADQQ